MEVRFEAWTRPDTGTFERKFPLVDFTQWNMKLGLFGQGLVVLPSGYTRLSDLLHVDPVDHTNDEASLIRAWIGDDWLYDFYASRISIDPNESGSRVATLTGGDLGSALTRTRVRAYDYPLSPSIESDWNYGYGPNLIGTSDFDERPQGIENPGAEEGSTLGWYTTSDVGRGYPLTFEAVESATAHGGDWHFMFEGAWAEGAVQDFDTTGYYSGTSPNEVWNGYLYQVGVWCKAPVGKAYRLEVHGAETVSTGVQFSDQARDDAVGTGAWQYRFVEFNADESGRGQLRVISLESTAIEVHFDDVIVNGWGIGVPGWDARGDVDLFEGSPLQSHSGSYSMKWQVSSGIAGNDTVYYPTQVKAGATVMAGGWVYHTEGSAKLFRIVIRKPGVDPNSSNVASQQYSVPHATWTYLPAAGYTSLPTVDVEFRYDETGAPSNDFFLDDVEAYQGHAAASVGAILGNLIDDAATEHAPNRTALAHLTPTFTSTLASDGSAWDTELAITIKRGQTYRRVLEIFSNEFGYEFQLRPNPSDPTEIYLDAYNPGDLGTDYSAVWSIGMAGVTSYGPLIWREPSAAYATVEGSEQEWGEDLHSALRTAWGDIETYTGSDELSAGSLDAAADLLTTGKEAATVVVRFSDPPKVPGIDYTIGDTIALSLGETDVPFGIYRCVAITVASGDPEPSFQVQFVSEGT